MNFNIDPSYDSHVHFFGTGTPAVEWDMKVQKSISSHLQSKKVLRGFGWKHSNEFTGEVKKYPDTKFFLSKIDGHTAFISNNLIKELNIDPVDFESIEGLGFLVSENQKDFIERLLPKRSTQDLEKMALHSQEIFLKEGFKKVRHLTCTLPQWNVLKKLESEKKLKIEIECFFSEFMDQTFEEAIEVFCEAEETNLLKPKGLKVFYDGSFGSKTAYSLLFPKVESRLTKEQLKNRIEIAFEIESDIAVHTIGEKAVEESLNSFMEVLKENPDSKTKLHLEHCPAMNESTINLLTGIPVVLHFQPSHYKGDKVYLDKLKLKGFLIYPFEELFKKNILFHFGSDSPVVNPVKTSLAETIAYLLP